MTIDDEKLRLWLEAAIESAFRAGAAEERAAVVAYLRAPGTSCDTGVLADCIERGDHRKEKP